MLPTPTPSPHSGGSAFNPPPAASVAEDHDLQLTVHRFNQLFPVPSFMRKGPAEPLGSKLAELFQTALQLAKTKDSLHLHVVRKLASDEGLERIKEMIDAIPKTSRLQVRHWQLLLQPFFQVIAHRDAFTTAHERPLRAIHDFLLNSTSNYIEAVYKHVCCVTSIFIATDEGSNLVIVEDLLDLSSKILKQILSDTSVDSLSSALRTTVQELHGHCDNLPGNLQRLSSAKETLDHILQTRKKAKTHPVGLAQQQDFVGYDPPGELSPRGPRHDNDHASIMDIRILPTVGEILAKRLPYAPLYDSSSWHVSGFRGLLDRHFRLLREDQLGPICNVIKQYLQKSSGSTSTYSEGNHVRTNEYTLRSLRVSYDRQDGFELHISTDQPTEVAARRTPAHREQWWVDTQNLDWERLVVIIGKSHAMFCLVSRATCRTFAQLHEKKDKNKKKRPRNYDPKRTLFSSSTHAYAVLNPINPVNADIDFILSFSGGAVQGVRLVEFPSVLLPSFKPMLMALQAMYADGHAPLSEYLVGDAGQSRADEHVAPPAYTTNLQLDLRSLTKNDSSLSYCVRNEPNTEQLCARSTLDQGQATAVLNTLRRRLALIQGPPGTGKSFTGEAIIKILLANKSKAGLGPIICICQTNHALDQLLEHLYHRRGIRRIVRLGAFSKSAIVGEMTLSKIMETTQPLKNELVANGKRSKARRKVAGQVIRALEDFSAADHGGREGLKDVIMRLNQEFERCAQAVDKGWSNVRARILREYDVVGVTTSGLAKFRDMLSSVGSKVVLCEEAGEVLEAHTLSALMPNLEHLILIGDHQQLRPRADNWAFRVANPDGKPWSWDISLFERLVKPLMFSDKRIPFDTLNVQRRMHPSIANLVRSTLYPTLQDAETVKDYPPLAGFKRRLYFYHHSRFEDKSKSGGSGDFSFHNRFEVEVVKTVLAHLHRQNVYGGGEIAVLTPYAGQLQMLKAQLGLTYDITMNDLDAAELETRNLMVSMGKAFGKPRIRVATVDNFQGEEASVIIVSLVRSNPQGKCGFLDQENRINVLLSRAKHGMIIIGNSDTYVHSDMWWKVLQTLENDGNVGTSFELPCPRHKGGTILASTAQHFINGSCKEKCGRPLQCSHICMETCHTKGVHDTTKCQALCGAILSCGHQCKQSCHFQKQCGPCDSISHRNQKHHVSSAGSTLRPAAGNRREPSPTTKPASSQNHASKPVAVLKPETRVSITTAENRFQQVGGTDHLDTENALHVADDLAKIDSGICESLIAFISTSHRRLVALELALLDEQDALHKSLLHAVSVNQVAHIASKDNRLVIDGQPFKMIQTVHDAIVGRYISAVSLMLQMNNFLREMTAEEKRFDNLISNGKSQERSAKFGQADCCLRLQSMLSAVVLLIRCNVVLLADFLSFRRQTKGQKPTVSINLDEFRFLCQFVVSTARQSCYPRHEVEAHVLIAKMITIAREVSGALKHANGLEDTAVAERHLQEARDLVLKHESLSYLLEDVEAVQGELSSSKFGHIVSSSTKRARWKQSGQEFQKTGYWHVCANGHPFSLEREAACTTFCFECDAPAGEHIIDRQDNHKEDCAESFDIDSEADDDLLVRLAQDFSRLDI
ncbi:hypothetical protein PFICI_12361 [Pestalotiopsis fici W106-1]|uniref:NF-X1-type domain-containing protein n=1 Tax=Pestalotiopsis fici (strain W106-1 / CGMCC3.15140) TaxID=1229662 RepID=W3WQJ6_PESFW|nr:uncharacterized protein PFICI_12361 [Pestalotiopsis fici W106-1]ETS75417.1 hypothetical protein PFICI_12361 [Pestalotiopsis fici W106-1]